MTIRVYTILPTGCNYPKLTKPECIADEKMLPFFPFRKIRRNGKWLLLGVVLILVAFSAYLAPSVNSIDDSHQKIQALCLNQAIKTGLRREKDTHTQHLHNSEDDVEGNTWTSSNNYQPWKPEYKGQVNLHVFEDWCGSSTAKLRANLHYPLYAHSRSTLKKLAVSPRWTNYGLRIFGYIHPSTDGEFLFAVASDDNCEFWLSMDESPASLQMCAYVGKVCVRLLQEAGSTVDMEVQLRLQQQQRYYFELIHKQDAEGTDHVEVAWRLNKAGTKFEIIASESLSLYTNESSLKMSDISHIPQTAASHVAATGWHSDHGADMLREDPRDDFYKTPLLDSSYLRGVLPECVYKPSYIIKGFPLLRYQGLQFVRLTYVYPNDYTRLTHMENDNKCFYQMRGLYLERYGFSRYMLLDQPEKQDVDLRYRDSGRVGWRERQVWQDYRRMEQEGEEDGVGIGGQLDYVEDYSDYRLHNSRRLLSSSLTKEKSKRKRELTGPARLEQESKTLPTTTAVLAGSLQEAQSIVGKPADSAGAVDRALEEPVEPAMLGHVTNSTVPGDLWKQDKMNILPPLGDSQPNNVDTRDTPQFKAEESSVFAKGRHAGLGLEGGVNNKLYFRGHEGKAARGVVSAEERDLGGVRSAGPTEGAAAEDGVAKIQPAARLAVPQGNGQFDHMGSQKAKNMFFEKRHKHWAQPYGKTKGTNKPVNGSHQTKSVHRDEWEIIAPLTEENNHAWKNKEGPEMVRERAIDDGIHERKWRLSTDKEEDNITEQWTLYRDSEGDEDLGWIAFDTEVNWAQTFQVMQHNFQNLRSDWIDLNCNVSGNLLIEETEAVAVVEAYMEKLEQKYPKKFSLQRIVNIEKRSDIGQGSRYLLELDLLDGQHQRVRLAHYVYVLEVFGRRLGRPGPGRAPQGPPLLCRPRGLQWSPRAAVHFIVPVKNQARWVQKFIMDMEELYRATGDENFNVIITDYSSTDMDVEQTLKKSHLPKYQYVRLNGNFQRSAGLQAGIDLITDEHSIVFLCDLHIHFPLGFIDSVRRHCVERHMAFAPIVMRLNCGATPQEPDGYWEVNGFGLLGIYKSDLDSIGGMNTRDFTDHWGGEDWELLDRILQAGLEVERIYMRNFFHHYHSRRGMWNRTTFRGK